LDGVGPSEWFKGVVSCAYVLLIERAHPGYRIVRRLSRSTTQSGSDVLDTVHALRTWMQHGFNAASREDGHRRDVVDRWFIDNCGALRPRDYHWRLLTVKLIDQVRAELRLVADRVGEIGRGESTHRAAVTIQILAQANRIPSWEWKRLIGLSGDELRCSCDPDAVYRRHGEWLAARLAERTIHAVSVEETARSLVRDAIVSEIAACPVDGRDLLTLGYSGARLKGAIEWCRAEWARRGATTGEELLRDVITGFPLRVP
jgi:hypothetical protein